MNTEQVSDQSEIPSGDTKKDSVSHETHRRLLEQHKKNQAEKEQLAARLREIEAQQMLVQEEKLRQEGNLKALLDSRDQRLKEVEAEKQKYVQQVETFQKTIVDGIKLSAFQNRLGGKLKKDVYFDHVELDRIPIDPETRRVDEAALNQYVEEFTQDFKELVSFENRGSLPGGAAKPTSQITIEQWQSLPLKDKKARLKDVINKK